MKRIQVVIGDAEYKKGLAEILIQEGAVPVVFEVADDYDLNSYEGLADASAPRATDKPSFESSFPEVVAWLDAYTGNFEFYLSLKSQLASKGMLSDKQIACVQRAIERDKANGVSIEAKPQTSTMEKGTVLVLSKSISNKIAQQAGYTRANHRAFEVVEVLGETEKAYRAKVRLSAKRTSFCGICGLTLENPQSVAAGIGPICADKLGIDWGGSSLAELEKAVSTTAEVVTWVPKRSIKERIER